MRKTVVAVAKAPAAAGSDRAFVGIAVIAAGNSLIPTSAGSAFAGVHGYKQNDDGGKQGGGDQGLLVAAVNIKRLLFDPGGGAGGRAGAARALDGGRRPQIPSAAGTGFICIRYLRTAIFAKSHRELPQLRSALRSMAAPMAAMIQPRETSMEARISDTATMPW